MNLIFKYKQTLKWFSFVLILFVCNEIFSQINKKSEMSEIMINNLETIKDLEDDVPIEPWMIKENFGMMKKIKFKENEQVIKVGAGTLLLDDKKIPVKVILTTQNRIYLNNSGIYDCEINNIKEITYFDRNYFNKDGVHIITKNNNVKFLIKKRKEWEKLFSKLY